MTKKRPIAWPKAKAGETIGLLGGSFNPAHKGHLHISRVARRRLKLDRIWWLVAPHNPLKAKSALAPYARRLASARSLARGKRILVSALEERLGLKFTVDTLALLKRRYKRVAFVWLMGADNLKDFHRWRSWRRLVRLVPIAVIARPGAKAKLKRQAAVLSRVRLKEQDAGKLAHMKPPVWALIHDRLEPQSATAIRKAGLWP